MPKRIIIATILLFGLFIKPDMVVAQSLTGFTIEGGEGSAKIAGIPFSLVITAKDEFNDTLTSFTGPVTLSDTTGTLYPPLTGPFVEGVWRGSVHATTAMDNIAITATYTSISTNSPLFSIVANNSIKFVSIISGNNQAGAVRTTLPTALSLRVVDAYYNPIGNVGVNFAVSSTPPGSINYSLTNATAITNASGVANTSFAFGTKTGTYIVTGSIASGITNTAHFYETATPASLMSIALTPPITVVPAGSYMQFAASGFDQYQNAITLGSVTWSIQNGGGTIDQTGIFRAGSTLGTYMNTIRALSGSIGSTATVTVVGAAGEAGGTATGSAVYTPAPTPEATLAPYPGSLYNVSIDPAVIAALRNTSIPISAQAYDVTGAAATNVVYDFQVEGDLGTLTRTGQSTAMLAVGESGIGTVTVTARQGDISRTARIVGSVGNGINRRLIIEEVTSPQTAGNPFTISIAAKDNQNNFVTDYKGPLVLADTTGTLDPAVISPSQNGIWYIQGIISLAHKEVTITVAGDGMVGVSNIFEVVGGPEMGSMKPGMAGLGTGVGEVLGASISALIDQLMLDKNLNRYTIFRYIGAGIAAGFGILGASIGGGIMASRGLEAIGRNPYAKVKLQANLYMSLLGFIIAAAMAVLSTFLILK